MILKINSLQSDFHCSCNHFFLYLKFNYHFRCSTANYTRNSNIEMNCHSQSAQESLPDPNEFFGEGSESLDISNPQDDLSMVESDSDKYYIYLDSDEGLLRKIHKFSII